MASLRAHWLANSEHFLMGSLTPTRHCEAPKATWQSIWDCIFG